MDTCDVCRWCGQGVQLDPIKEEVWVHIKYFLLVCRDIKGKLVEPMRFAEPTEWEVSE